MNILVTAGATREPIDAVRYLSNQSTGSTGSTIADAFAARGHTVTLLRGEGATRPKTVTDLEVFFSTEDLRHRLRQRLTTGTFDAVVMAAGVSDYRPEQIAVRKISSAATKLTLTLVRTPKIVPELKSFSPRPLVVVGFKLTVGAGEDERRTAVRQQFATGGIDAVVHNDLNDIRAAMVHPFNLYRAPDAAPQRIAGSQALGEALVALVAGR
jgi:phosphopantothenoylcysteine decarboxylase/phosphopantothenate--cysteine ligase